MSPSKVKVTNNKAIKTVSAVEATGISSVYPTNNGLLLRRPIKLNDNSYEIHMKPLIALKDLKKSELKGLTFTKRSMNMLENQLNRLHKSGRTHSDLKASNGNPKLEKRVQGVLRQILVNLNGNTVEQMYLSDFDFRNTGDTKNQEKAIVSNFIRYVSTLGNNNNNRINSPPRKVARLLF